MNKLWKVLFIVGVLLAISFTVASAGGGKPPQPVCDEGYITVEEAEWVDGYWETKEVCEEVPIYEYSCPVVSWSWRQHNVQVPYEKSQDPTKCHRPSDSKLRLVYGMLGRERKAFKKAHGQWKNAISEIVGYETVCHDERIWVDGHWTDPVCEAPPVGEQCGRCSNVFEGWVEWYDRDGGCDDDYYNERVPYPGDERCVNCDEKENCEPDIPEAPTCDYDRLVLQEPVWDAELGEWVGLKCRCKLTGNFEYYFDPAPGSFLRGCTLVTDKAGGGGANVIPSRFLNKDYVNVACSCVDCDGETPREFIWDGEDPDIYPQNVCQTYLGPLCLPE